MEDASPSPLPAAPWLGRLTRASGVFLIVLVFFTPWFAERRSNGPFQVDTCFTLALHRAREVHDRGLVLPFRAFDAPTSPARQHAMWSLESPLVIALLASILAGALALALRPLQRRLPRLPLGGALIGTASAATLVLRSVTSKHGLYTTDFQDSTLAGELVSWAAALAPSALGAAAFFGAWQRRSWGKRALRALAAISVLALVLPHELEFESASSFGQEAHWGSRAAVVLCALALLLERRRVSPLIEPLPESDVPAAEIRQEAQASPSPRESRVAKTLSIAVLVLSVSLLLVLTRRATRPPRLNDPWDDWPLFLDVNKPQQHTAPIHGLTFSPKGDVLASGSEDGTVKLWEIPSGRLLRSIRAGDRVSGVAISPGGEFIAASSPFDVERVAVRIWSLTDGKLVRELSLLGGAYSVAFSPRGNLIGFNNAETVSIWSTSDWSYVHNFPAHAFAFAPQDDLIVTTLPGSEGSGHGVVLSTSDGSVVRELEESDGAYCFSFSPLGDLIAGARSGYGLCLWSAPTGKLISSTKLTGASEIAFSPIGGQLAATEQVAIRVRSVPDLASMISHDRTRTNEAMAWSPDGAVLAVTDNYTLSIDFIPVPKR